MNPCSNRCLIAMNSMAVLRSASFRVDDSHLSRTSYKLLTSVITEALRVKHFGEFQRVKRYHLGLSLTSKGTAHNTFPCVALRVNPWSLLWNHATFVRQQRWSDYHLVRIHLAAHSSQSHQSQLKSDRPRESVKHELARVRVVDTIE